ncbi:MAG: chalcone isomerase family protein [Parachlamydiales bacterium]|jgi:hypothetical protein
MKSMLIKFFSVFFCMFSLSLCAQGTLTDSATGESFPKDISISYNGKQYDLTATGVATRKKLFIKVYSIASYLQKGAAQTKSDTLKAILNDNNAKQVTMKWQREVGVDKIQETYRESLQKSLPNAQGQLKNDVGQFLSFFNQPVRKGDTTIIKWLPGGYIEVDFNGTKVGSVVNKDLAAGIWNVWFGEKSPVNRDNLLQ